MLGVQHAALRQMGKHILCFCAVGLFFWFFFLTLPLLFVSLVALLHTTCCNEPKMRLFHEMLSAGSRLLSPLVTLVIIMILQIIVLMITLFSLLPMISFSLFFTFSSMPIRHVSCIYFSNTTCNIKLEEDQFQCQSAFASPCGLHWDKHGEW